MSYSIKVNLMAFNYIPFEFRDKCYNYMVNDIYYFYNNIKPNNNQKIICIDGNNLNLSRDNIYLIIIIFL
jgi:hypothetical protein